MANEEHLARLREGVEVWNRWRAAHRDIQPKLSRADLRKTHLRKTYLQEANLIGAILGGAVLSEAHLAGADLSKADLTRVVLTRADLSKADLGGAKLVRASFTQVGSEGDLTQDTLAQPAPRAARHLVKDPQCVGVKVYKSDRLRWSNTVGFIAHGGKGCCDSVG